MLDFAKRSRLRPINRRWHIEAAKRHCIGAAGVPISTNTNRLWALAERKAPVRARPSFIAAMNFVVLEIAYFIMFLLLRYENQTELYQPTIYISIASWIAFVVFVAIIFHPFAYRWLRVVIAFIVFITVPAIFSLALTKMLVDANAGKLWFELAFLGTSAIKLGIAATLYAWAGSRKPSGQCA